MAPRRKRTQTEWPQWYYSPDGQAEIFESPEGIPDGWTTNQQLQFEFAEPKVEIHKDTVLDEFNSRGIKADPRWGKAKLWEELQKVIG